MFSLFYHTIYIHAAGHEYTCTIITTYTPANITQKVANHHALTSQWANGIRANITGSVTTNSRDYCKQLFHGGRAIADRLSYIAQGKGATDYDVDMERDWKQLIKNLDPEKKTVQACFTSLVNVSQIILVALRY